MTSNQCILLSHVYIREKEEYKLDIVNYAVRHFRLHNPNTYIILTGHGLKPSNHNLVDYCYWQENIIEKEINLGHPFLVNVGFDHALEKKFTKICKTRADGIHLIKNLVDFCEIILDNKKILITQQTKLDDQEMGDLFLYGDLKFLKNCWNLSTWYPTSTGLKSLGNNFINQHLNKNWISNLKSSCSFIDIYNLKWIDFRANWHLLLDQKENMMGNILPNFHEFLWGSNENWHRFDEQGNLLGKNKKKYITEKIWKNL